MSDPAATKLLTPGGTTDEPFWNDIWDANGKQLQPGERFDVCGPHTMLVEAIERGDVPEGRACVPGCGRGYDVGALASAKRHVTGLEYTALGAEAARKYLSKAFPANSAWYDIVQADFFTYQPPQPFDFVYDYTFLCALQPAMRRGWAAKMHDIIRPGGVLMTLQFPLGPLAMHGDPPRDDVGPPFLLSKQLYVDLLVPLGFALLSEADVPPEKSPAMGGGGRAGGRAGLEAVAFWIRK
jgi:hypothetical protein